MVEVTADRRFRRMLGASRQTSVVGVIGSVVGGSDTGSVIGAKLVPATGAEFFGFFSRSRRSPSAAASSFSADGSRFGAVRPVHAMLQSQLQCTQAGLHQRSSQVILRNP